jgi:hypothetical protein
MSAPINAAATVAAASWHIPDVVWAAVISSVLAITGVILANWHSRKLLRMQLEADATQRDRDRMMALRRDVYLPAAEALTVLQTCMGDVLDIEDEMSERKQRVADSLTLLSKIHVVGSEATVTAVLKFERVFAPAYLELVLARASLVLRQTEIKTHTSSFEKANANVQRTSASLTQFKLSGRTDLEGEQLEKQLKDENSELLKHVLKLLELLAAQVAEVLTFCNRATALGVEIAECLPDAILAVRSELDFAIDSEAYRKLFAEQTENVRQISITYLNRVRGTLLSKFQAGKDQIAHIEPDKATDSAASPPPSAGGNIESSPAAGPQ